MRLVLFDIDGTLLDCGVQVRGILAEAMNEVFGVTADVDGYDFAGRTDDRIASDLLLQAGVAPERVKEGLPALRREYVERLEASLDGKRMRLLPGVRELLTRLSHREDVVVGLLTGNWEGGARVKLSRFELDPFFLCGAYGDDCLDRRQLPPKALAAAAAASDHTFPPPAVVIVGDSPLDVDCARHHGIPSLAVATGRATLSQLTEAGADWVIPGLDAVGTLRDPLFATTG